MTSTVNSNGKRPDLDDSYFSDLANVVGSTGSEAESPKPKEEFEDDLFAEEDLIGSVVDLVMKKENQFDQADLEDIYDADDEDYGYNPDEDDYADEIAATLEAEEQDEDVPSFSLRQQQPQLQQPTQLQQPVQQPEPEIDTADEEAYYQQQQQPPQEFPIPVVIPATPSASPISRFEDDDNDSPMPNLSLPSDEDDDEEVDQLPASVTEGVTEGEDSTGTVNISSGYQNDEQGEQGDDEEEGLTNDPAANRTKVTLINSPISQLVLVAGSVLGITLVVGIALSALTGNRGEQKPVIAQSPPPETGVNPNQQGSDNDPEKAKYKSETAMGDQQKIINGISKSGQPQPSPSPTASPVVKKPAPTASPVAVAPLPSVPMPVANLPVAPTAISEKPTLEDSVRTWQLLSSVGSYGRVPNSGGSSGNSNRTATTPSTSPLFNTPPVSSTPTFTPSTASSSGGGMSIQQLRANSSIPGMRDRPLTPVLVGTNSKGQLGTAIVLSNDNSSAIDPTNPRASKYLVQLTDAIKDADGGVAIPAGTMVVAAVRTFSPSTGKAELQAIAVIVNNREYKLPEGAVIIRAADGGMLALQQQGGKSKFFANLIPALMAGVAQAGQAINQPNSSSVVSSGSVVTSTTSSKNQNLTAAFASGAANSLSQQLTQSIQTANQAASQQQKAWAIGAGAAVQVFVNSTFEM